MATQVTNYQCPACTGPLQFSPHTGKLECEYCGSSFTTEEVDAYYAEENRKAQQSGQRAERQPDENAWGADSANMRAYNCPSCGAELICDDTTAASACPYCGNPNVVPGQFRDERKPDYVIPFRVGKEQAVEALRRHYKGKPLLPKAFAAENHLQEVKGVYVPFWLFDGTAHADVTFSATKSKTVTTPTERITTTEHYQVRRSGTVEFEKVPVDASTKMPDAHMDAIEPYNYEEITPFSMSYLPGFLAERFDQDADQCARRVEERCRNSAVEAMEADVTGYSTCDVQQANVKISRDTARYALLPVWLLSTTWQEKNYLFAMNGQTGKLIGDLPVSKGKLAAWFAGLFVLFTVLGSAMFPIEGALIGGAVIAGVVCAVMAGTMKTAVMQSDAQGYITAGGARITGRSDQFLRRSVSRQPVSAGNSSHGGPGPAARSPGVTPVNRGPAGPHPGRGPGVTPMGRGPGGSHPGRGPGGMPMGRGHGGPRPGRGPGGPGRPGR